MKKVFSCSWKIVQSLAAHQNLSIYGAHVPVWAHVAKSNLAKLDKIHHGAGRIMTGATRSTPNMNIEHEAKLLPQ